MRAETKTGMNAQEDEERLPFERRAALPSHGGIMAERYVRVRLKYDVCCRLEPAIDSPPVFPAAAWESRAPRPA